MPGRSDVNGKHDVDGRSLRGRNSSLLSLRWKRDCVQMHNWYLWISAHVSVSRCRYKNVSKDIREYPARRDDYNWRTQRYRGKCIPLRVINNSAFSQQTQLCFLSPWLISAVCVSSQYDINSSKILINLRPHHSY